MYRTILAVAICTALAAPAWAHDTNHTLDLSLPDAAPVALQQTTSDQSAPDQQDTQDQNQDQDQSQNKKQKSTKLKTIMVTGSLIPRSQIETATPTITITNEEMERHGFATVADALGALPQATGSVQGAQFSAGFTQGAKTISLLGLDPGFTLFLINGKPMADYPLLYNGSSNFVDISTIPMAMVDHIDIVPGNQSAIYGSSAIAGVVNVILKQHVNGLTVSFRGGGFSEGGGGSQRLQITGGHDWSKASLTYALELRHQQPLYRYQRSWFDSLNDRPGLAPGASRHGLDYLLLDAFHTAGSDWFFVPGGPSRCDGVKQAFGGTTEYFEDPAGRGVACGSPISPAYSTMMNEVKQATGYVNFNYNFTPNTQLYANVMYNLRNVDYFVGSTYTWWGSYNDLGFVYAANVDNGYTDDGPGTFLRTQYTIDTSPTGIGHLSDQKNLNRTYIANLGVRGFFGNSDWGYDAYYHRSDNSVTARQLHLIGEKVDHYFLGDQIGVDPLGLGYPSYNLNLDRFYSPMSPEDYKSISGQIRTRSHTYTQEVAAVVNNTNLFDLPGGTAGIAMLLQYGNQYWENPTDPRVIAGYFWGLTGTQGSGKRDRYAAALELTMPFTTWLTLDTSVRYDTYKASGRTDSKATYKVGLEFRPTDTLLLRATYATAFRAPDMAYLYKGPSGFYTNVVDYYRCRLLLGDHFEVDQCPYNNEQVFGMKNGNKDLGNITASSVTGGIVWSPTPDFNIHADYYRIKIDNEVSSRSFMSIMSQEADCRIGHNRNGAPVDINSPTCVEALALVTRNNNPSDPLASGLAEVNTYPINISNENVSGVMAGFRYHMNAGAVGDFRFGGNYNVTLKHERQQYPGDPVHDELSMLYLFEFKSRATASINWTKGRWGATVYGIRDGSMSNWQGTGRLSPYTTYNVSLVYHPNDHVKLSLVSNNVLNRRPPYDPSNTSYPYYDGFHYNGYGRSIFAELTWKFL